MFYTFILYVYFFVKFLEHILLIQISLTILIIYTFISVEHAKNKQKKTPTISY